MGLMDDDLNMAEIISAIQGEEVRTSTVEDDLLRSKLRICQLEEELARLVECVAKHDGDSFDRYQTEVMEAAKFGSVDHIAVEELLTCFVGAGRIAEISKKAFRDRDGVFRKSDTDDIFIEGSKIGEASTLASSMCENHVGKDGGSPILYPLFGIIGEAGEVVEKILKIYVHDHTVRRMSEHQRVAIATEVSDVLWYITALANMLGYDLSEIAQINREKRGSRRERGVIQGEGDNR